MRTHMTIVAVLALAGCGGSKKGADEPGGGVTSAEESELEAGEPDDPEFIQPEKIDEINHAFSRRRPQISNCYAEAVRSGQLKKTESGRVSVVVRINTSGRAEKVEIVGASTLKGDALYDCMTREIKKWDLPRPNVAFDFSFSYDFMEGI